jgi:Ca2+-binding RTX toxin-like protein
VRRLVTPHSNLADRESKDRYRHKRVQLLVKITAGLMSRGSTKASDYREPQTMSARRIFAVVCAALALTFVSGSAALAYSTDSAKPPSTTDDTCGSPDAIRGTNGDDTGVHALVGTPGDDIICGFGGNDEIYGMGGDDRIFGGGKDTLLGQTGTDKIYANDLANTDDGIADIIDGGNGNDKCVYIPSPPDADKVSNCP